MDCPNFPVMVVLFSANLMQNADPEYLEAFTGYRREFIEGIAANMTNNGLWKAHKYLATSWLQEGHIDEEEFINQVDAAMGCLWYSKQATEHETVDLIWINPGPDDRVWI